MANLPDFLRRGFFLPIFRKIFSPPKDIIISLPKYQIKFYIADAKDRMQSMIYYFNEYEPHITSLIIDNLSEGGCFFDIGASVGYFSIIAAKKVGLRGKVIAFEPLPRNYEALEKNCFINGFNNILTNNIAVSDRVGRTTFYPPNNPNEWGTGSIFDGDKKEAFDLPCTTLEYYIKSQSIKHIDLIKIDTEGSELKIINGLKPVIANVGYPKIICEVNKDWLKLANAEPIDLINRLKSLGYKIYKIKKQKLTIIGDDLDPLFNIFAVHGGQS